MADLLHWFTRPARRWVARRRTAREAAVLGWAVADITAYLAGYQSRPAGSPSRVLVCSQAIRDALREVSAPDAPKPRAWGIPGLGYYDRVPVVVDPDMQWGRYALVDARTYAARLQTASRSDNPSTES